MNPWSKAEPGSESAAPSAQGNESFERDLFARRARAMAPAAIPSLASVMRAARANAEEATQEERSAPGTRGRALVALALAAACMMAAFTRVPRSETSERIVADMDAASSAPRGVLHSVGTFSPTFSSPFSSMSAAAEAPPAGECSLGEEVLSSEERACFAPSVSTAPSVTAATPLFTPVTPLSPTTSPDLPSAEPSCAAELSCELPPP